MEACSITQTRVCQSFESEDMMKLGIRQLFTQIHGTSSNPRWMLCSKIGVPQRSYAKEHSKEINSLLHYPVNELGQTMQKFLRSCAPLLTKEELQKTAVLTDEFISGEGRNLQALLEKEAAKSNNWLAQRWLKAAYLQYRDPVTVYSSPGMTLPLTTFNSDQEYLMHCAKLIMGLVKYKDMVDSGKIPIVKMGGRILDNSQFSRVFGTCRIPGYDEDSLQYNSNSKHIVVIYQDNFYKLPVYNEDNCIINAKSLATQLNDIKTLSNGSGVPYGLLTHQSRNDWADCYHELLRSLKNTATIKEIQRSLFTVSLDKAVLSTKEEVYDKLAVQLLHGGGRGENSANRWMDKTIQLIVNANGMTGFCYEHSPAEGQPIAQMAEYLTSILPRENEFVTGSDKMMPFTKLEFEAPSQIMKEKLHRAEANFTRLSSDLQLTVLHFDKFGKEFLKKYKLRPDSFIQTAIQYAFYRLHQVPAAQYETAHLRIFENGRTETIRSCTLEALGFAQSMMNKKANNTICFEMLKKAINAHSQYMEMAMEGCGVDRHLLGLKLMALENNLPVPSFYQSPGFVKTTHFRLSTSQVASKDPVFMCYGPLTHDGYSCCYNPRADDIFFAMGAWHSHPETCAKQFANSLENALSEMQLLVQEANKDALKSKL